MTVIPFSKTPERRESFAVVMSLEPSKNMRRAILAAKTSLFAVGIRPEMVLPSEITIISTDDVALLQNQHPWMQSSEEAIGRLKHPSYLGMARQIMPASLTATRHTVNGEMTDYAIGATFASRAIDSTLSSLYKKVGIEYSGSNVLQVPIFNGVPEQYVHSGLQALHSALAGSRTSTLFTHLESSISK